MAPFAHLGVIPRSRRCMLGRANALAIPIDRFDRFSCSHNRGVATVASGRWYFEEVNPFPAPEIGRYGRKWNIAPVCPGSPPSTIPVFPPVD